MPREWAPVSELAGILKDCVETEFPQIKNMNISVEVQTTIEQCYLNNVGYGDERKISRLNEKIRDAVGTETYGPLLEGIDGNGDPVFTPLGMLYNDWLQIQIPAFLANFDEEGELIGGG
jgi:hypothetical protein